MRNARALMARFGNLETTFGELVSLESVSQVNTQNVDLDCSAFRLSPLAAPHLL